jgi:hypothetical protein
VKQRILHLVLALRRIPTGWWVVALTLPALLPLWRAGVPETIDGPFHIYRLAALDRAVRAGVLYPRWFPEFAFGYGQPVLNSYGPLAYYWGLPFTALGADAALATKLVLASGLVASALAMYLFGRLHMAPGPALVAAAVYVYLPYHLLNLYARGALAEFLGFVWLPLVLWAFHRLLTAPGHKPLWLALAALLSGALVVTHSLSALIFAPFAAVYVVLVALAHRRPRIVGDLFLALGLAASLTAFYWLPVLAESRYVGLAHDVSSGYRDHLLPWRDLVSWSFAYAYGAEPGVPTTYPLGPAQLLILGAAGVQLCCRHRRRWPLFFFGGLTLFSALMLTETSLPVWLVFERGLAFLQYPWRFQVLTTLGIAFLGGALLEGWTRSSRSARAIGGGLLLVAVAVWALWRLPVTSTTPDLSIEAMWQMEREIGQVGTTWTGEYLPIWVAEQRWALSHPAPEPVPDDATLPAGQVQLARVGYTSYTLRVVSPQATSLVLHQFHYPGWQALGRAAGLPSESRPDGPLGLARLDLPPGPDRITVRLAPTLTQRVGTLVSLLTALTVASVLVIPIRAPRPAGQWLLAAAYGLLLCLLLAHLLLPNGSRHAVVRVNANLEDRVELLSFTTDKKAYHPGDTVSVTLYWHSLRRLDQNYKAFVHLTDAAMTRQPAQHDGDPGGGFTPTTRWLPGEIVPDRHALLLPRDLPPGIYRLWGGLYESDTVRNLAVLSADTDRADNRILLGEITVRAP